MNLGMILTQQSKSLRFVEQNLKFDFKHPNDIEAVPNINVNVTVGTTIPSQEIYNTSVPGAVLSNDGHTLDT